MSNHSNFCKCGTPIPEGRYTCSICLNSPGGKTPSAMINQSIIAKIADVFVSDGMMSRFTGIAFVKRVLELNEEMQSASTHKSFFDTPEYLAAKAKAIEFLEDRLLKDSVDLDVDGEFATPQEAWKAAQEMSGIPDAALGIKPEGIQWTKEELEILEKAKSYWRKPVAWIYEYETNDSIWQITTSFNKPHQKYIRNLRPLYE